MRILQARSRAGSVTTVAARAVGRAADPVLRAVIGIAGRVAMIAVAGVRRDPVDAAESRENSAALAGSAMIVDSATSVRRSRRCRACPW